MNPQALSTDLPDGSLETLTRTGLNPRVESFAYDAFHRQTQQTVNGQTTQNAYILDGWQRHSVTAPNGDMTSFVWEGSDMAASTVTPVAGSPVETNYLHNGRMPLAHAINGTVTTYGRDLMGDITG
ncbi:MAG: hypothetical protein AAB263_20530 [Planctomycetota bacterium]